MSTITIWLGRVLSALATTSLAQGILLWLDKSHQINVPEMVANMIGQIEQEWVNPTAVHYFILAIAGIVGFLVWLLVERHWSQRAEASDAAIIATQAELEKQRRLQDKQDQAREGLRGPSSAKRVAIKMGGLKDSTITDNVVVGADLLEAEYVTNTEISRNVQIEGEASETAAKYEDDKSHVTLHEAVMEAWEQIRLLREFNEPPSQLVNFSTLRDYYESDPSELPGIAAQIIFNNADPPIPIEGIAPPRTTAEIIPHEKAQGYQFSDDAKMMFDIFDKDKPLEKQRRYIDLRVKKADIYERIKQIERDNG